MVGLSHGNKRRSPIAIFISLWWRDWTSQGPVLDPLCCAEGEVERIAKDIGLPAAEVRRLARLGPGSADLLLRRMEALKLDPKKVTQAEPQLFRDLERVCSLCESRRQCSRDLARELNNQEWEDYCPNIATLKMLNAMPWAARVE